MNTKFTRPFACVALIAVWIGVTVVTIATHAADDTSISSDETLASQGVPSLLVHIQNLDAQIYHAHRDKKLTLRNNLIADRLRTANRVLTAHNATRLEFYLAAKAKMHSLLTLAQDSEIRFREAVKFAMNLKTHQEPRVRRLGEFNNIALMILAVHDADKDDLNQIIHDYSTYISKYKLKHGSLELGRMIVRTFEESGFGPEAAEIYWHMSDHAQRSSEYAIRQHSAWFKQRADSIHLVGKQLKINHSGYHSQRITNDHFTGRVLLVHFWQSTPEGTRDFQTLRNAIQKHRGDGFEILGVCMDQDHRTAHATIKKNVLPWPNLFELGDVQKRGMKHPLAQIVRPQSLPMSLLLNRQGKVVSMTARGRELDRLLQVHLQEPVSEEQIARWRKKGAQFMARDDGNANEPSKTTASTDKADTKTASTQTEEKNTTSMTPDLLKVQLQADARLREQKDSTAAEE